MIFDYFWLVNAFVVLFPRQPTAPIFTSFPPSAMLGQDGIMSKTIFFEIFLFILKPFCSKKAKNGQQD